MHDFILALIGGMMIGLAAVFLMASHGRIMGVSGIVSSLLPPSSKDWQWRISFIAGVLAAPIIVRVVTDNELSITVSNNTPLLIFAGMLVGIGTTLGSGCTSGHGVCGLPRLSTRSITATVVFMVSGVITVYLVRHVIGV